MVQHAVSEATGKKEKPKRKNDVSERDVVVLGWGNLGLVYLMELDRRLTGEEIDARHPDLIPTLRTPPHRLVLVRSAEHGAVVLGHTASATSTRAGSRAPIRSRTSPTAAPSAAHRRLRHVADIMVGSFYDPMLDEGCAFEELISFHGGLGGPQTRAFILAPARLPDRPILAPPPCTACSGWRRTPRARPRGRRQPAPRAAAARRRAAESSGGDEVAGEQPAATRDAASSSASPETWSTSTAANAAPGPARRRARARPRLRRAARAGGATALALVQTEVGRGPTTSPAPSPCRSMAPMSPDSASRR
jgi:hypothetical protein